MVCLPFLLLYYHTYLFLSSDYFYFTYHLHLSTKKVTYTLKKGETTVVEATTADFVNPDTTVLDRVFIAAGKYCGGVLMDNLKIEAVQ